MKLKVGIAATGLVLGSFAFVKPAAGATNLHMVANSITNGIVEMEVRWPTSFTNNLEIFACTNLLEQGWQVVSPNLSTTGTTGLAWVDTDSTNHAQRFYVAGNADLDTDGDGLADAREYLLFGTDPSIPDSDHDGIGDYDEINTIRGYEVGSVPFEWVDLNGVGSPVAFMSPWGDWEDPEAGVATIPLGFDFGFYGQDYPEIWAGVNGLISFEPMQYGDENNEDLPTFAPCALVASFWDVLYGGHGQALVHTFNRNRFVITYQNFKISADWNSSITFQAEFQKSGDIYLRYHTLLNGTENYADGSSATIGLQNADGSGAVLYSYNQAGAVSKDTALRFSPKKTDPLNDDSDGDGIKDGYEAVLPFLDPLDPSDALEDEDNDGLSNVLELEEGIDPENEDTDGDGLKDGGEYQYGLDPRRALESDRTPDSDGDGMPNGYEADHGLDAFDAADKTMDKDEDGLSNGLEFLIGTYPDRKDSDGDELEDGEEVLCTPYSVSEMSAFDWVDIIPTGTKVVFGNLYTGGEQLAIGFPFPYYGATFDQLSVHVKGYMTFGAGEPSQFQNGRMLPDPSAPKNMLAAFWGRLSMADKPTSKLYYQVQGVEPDRVLIVSWHDITIQGWDPGASLNFQIQLRENTGDIVYSYNDMLSANSAFEDGSDATVGLQNGDGTAGILWSYNQIGAINSQMSLLFAYDPLAYTVVTQPMNADTDGDGIKDGFEVAHSLFLDPLDSSDAALDEDGDGLSNLTEYQIGTWLDYWDTDFDGLGDYGEYHHGLNYLEAWPSDRDADSDGDGMPNGYEVDHYLKPFDASDASEDRDEDGLSNLFEHDNGLDPSDYDMDNDGLSDAEVLYGLDPHTADPAELLSDSDADGLNNGYEVDPWLDPFETDLVADQDGIAKAEELSLGSSPVDGDTDKDGLPDGLERDWNLSLTTYNDPNTDDEPDGLGLYEEYVRGCDPTLSDSDSDGLLDGVDPYPSANKPVIAISAPTAGSTVSLQTILIEGSVSFTGNSISVKIRGEDALVSQSGTNWTFSKEISFSGNGAEKIRVEAVGTNGTAVLYNVLDQVVEVDAYGPCLLFTSYPDGSVVQTLYAHIKIHTNDDAPVFVNGQPMAKDGFMNYAWVLLASGTNTMNATSTSASGNLSSQSINLVCNVPAGYTEDPPVDMDMDGVMDPEDYAPDDPTVTGQIQVTSPPNGIILNVQ